MLSIVEVHSEEHFEELRKKESSAKDYLYILKYNGTMVLSDNGTIIPLGSDNLNITDEDILNIANEIITEWENDYNEFSTS